VTDNVNRVALGDIDGDGDLDAIVAGGSDGRAWFNDGTGRFSPGQSFFSSRGGGYAIQLGDLNGDGNLDVVSQTTDDNTSDVFLNDGTGHFHLSQTLSNTASFALGDINGDGSLDAFVINKATSMKQWWRICLFE
jgi:hypothetical protein